MIESIFGVMETTRISGNSFAAWLNPFSVALTEYTG
jgi:hypothetical protein